jgi:hypothetical protein
MTYNNTIHSATGYTPFFLSTGREFRLPTDYVPDELEEVSTSVNAYAESLSRLLARARQDIKELSFILAGKLEKSQEGKVQTEFEVGEQVMLFIPSTKPGVSSKLVRRWVGPFVVSEKCSSKVYVLADENGRVVSNKVSVLRLKSYNDRKTVGSKWLTTEFDERLDIALSKDKVVRDVVDKQLRDLIDLNEEDEEDDRLQDKEIIPDYMDFFVPPEEHLDNFEEDNDDEDDKDNVNHNYNKNTPRPRKRAKIDEDAMIIDESQVNDEDMNRAIGHEAYVDETGVVRLKDRVATNRDRHERITRRPPQKYGY